MLTRKKREYCTRCLNINVEYRYTLCANMHKAMKSCNIVTLHDMNILERHLSGKGWVCIKLREKKTFKWVRKDQINHIMYVLWNNRTLPDGHSTQSGGKNSSHTHGFHSFLCYKITPQRNIVFLKIMLQNVISCERGGKVCVWNSKALWDGDARTTAKPSHQVGLPFQPLTLFSNWILRFSHCFLLHI